MDITKRNKIINLVLANKSESDTYLRSSNFFDEWTSWYDMYRGIPGTKPYHWMSNKFIPMTFGKVETAYAALQSILFATHPPFEVLPREEQDRESASIFQRLLSYQFDETNVFQEFSLFLKSLLIHGTAIGKVVWDTTFTKSTQWIEDKEPLFNLFGLKIGERFKGYKEEESRTRTFDGPRFLNLNISDIFPDPQAVDIQDGWVIHRTRRTRGYLLQLLTNFPDSFTREILQITDEDGTETQSNKEDIEQSMGRLYQPQVSRPKYTSLIELLEWWGDYDFDDDGELEPCIFTVAAGKYLIRAERNPYWHGLKPFIKGVYVSVPNDFYGIGIPEVLEDLQLTLNETFDQRNDNVSFALNKPAIFKRGSGIDTRKLIFKPGGIYGTDEEITGSLQFLDIANFTRDSHLHQADIERWAQEATAITSLTMGLGQQEGGKTATEAQIRQRATGNRLGIIAKIIEYSGLQTLLKFFYQLNYQFMNQTQIVRIVGEKGYNFVKVKPGDIRKNYDLKVTGTFTSENRERKALRLIQFYNLTKGDPLIKVDALLRKLYIALDIGDTPEELFKTPQELQQQFTGGAPTQPPEKLPGLGSQATQFTGGEMPGVPGVPPVSPGIPPMERV